MRCCTYREWKQFTEGIARGVVGPFEWSNSNSGADAFRTYLDNGEAIAEMRVHDCNTDKLGQDCVRTFMVESRLLELCSDIAVLTDTDWEEWDNARPDEFDDEEWLRAKGEIL